MFARTGTMILTAALFSGCINSQLRNNTVDECRALGDVYEQQVMNNLAMFVYDPDSMPYFSYATTMASQVTNTAQGSVTPTLGYPTQLKNLVFSSLGFTGQATNANNETFNMFPVTDPRKLDLMRCAYQKAMAGCLGRDMSRSCPDCKTRFNMFYTGSKNGDISEKSDGRITTECFAKVGWFHVGCKKQLPPKCDCLAVGDYCGVYVWVDCYGRDQLTKLTMTILDFAVNAQPVPVTKQVVYFIDQDGLPTTQRQAVGMVAANVRYDECPESVVYVDEKSAVNLEQFLQGQEQALEKQIIDIEELPSGQSKEGTKEYLRSLLDQQRVLKAKLEFLKLQLDSGGLKHPYETIQPPQPSGGILDLKTQLQGVTPAATPAIPQ